MVKLWRITYHAGFGTTYHDMIGDDIIEVLREFGKYLKKDYVDTSLTNITNIELRGDTGND